MAHAIACNNEVGDRELNGRRHASEQLSFHFHYNYNVSLWVCMCTDLTQSYPALIIPGFSRLGQVYMYTPKDCTQLKKLTEE